MSLFSKFRFLLSVIAVILGCSLLQAADMRNKSSLLGDTSKFKQSKQKKTFYYDRPGSKRAIDYTKMMFEPVMIEQSEHSVYRPLSEQDKATLSELLRSMAIDEFKSVVTIVDQPGEGVLIVRMGLRGLKRGNYHMTSSGTKAITPDEKAPAGVFEAEAVDATTHERVIAVVDEIGKKKIANSEREEIVPTVRDLFQSWVRELRDTFRQEQNLATIPK